MARWKMPPRAKVYEAFGALADGRVRLLEPGKAAVVSSGGDKTYDVEWSGDGAVITSNDNASYWQGYAGYPIIAVLLALGRLTSDETTTSPLAGVDWHGLNARFRRDYEAAVEHVLRGLDESGADTAAIRSAVDQVMAQLERLELERPGRGRRPPEGG